MPRTIRLKSDKGLAVAGSCRTTAIKIPSGKKNCYIRWFEAAQIQNPSPGLERLVRVIGVPHPSWFTLGEGWFSEAWEKLPLLEADPIKVPGFKHKGLTQARQMLRKLLDGYILCEPILEDGQRGYRFTATGTFDRLLTGAKVVNDGGGGQGS